MLGAGLLVGACAGPHRPTAGGSTERAEIHPHSNIVRADYAGSAACGACHPDIYEAWLRSPMHNMTRLPTQAPMRAPFDGRTVRFKSDQAKLVQAGDERFMQIRSPAFGDHTYRITKLIGGHHREDFAGVEVARAEAGAPRLAHDDAELILPLSYVYESQSFRVKGYSVMVGERPGLRAGGVWNQTCVLCHNTLPLFDSLWGALYGPGAPSYQGEVVDRVLPVERRHGWRVTSETGLVTALENEIQFLGGTVAPAVVERQALLANAAETLRQRLVPAKFVELGIGCESCHGGSREHVRRNDVLPSFEPLSPFLAMTRPSGATATKAEAINRACARCHQVLFSRYPYTWEGGLRRHTPGGSHITSGEARDFLLGGCARQMACSTCHDPHGADDPGKLQALATPAGNGVCLGCHAQFATPAALRAHAHHQPGGAGGACVACHMPRKNMGLGYQLTRYHRIGSPTDRARVEGDRPLECALCHPTARVGELVATMERWWNKRYDPTKLRDLYGDLGAPVLTATLARGRPHEQATAIAVLGDAKAKEATAALAATLAHPYPLVRYYARAALEKIRGAPVPVDLEQEEGDIRAATAHWLDPHSTIAPPRRATAFRAAPAPDDED